MPLELRHDEARTQISAIRTAVKTAESRAEPRYDQVLSLSAWPVLPDGRLDEEGRLDGFTWDVSAAGISFELDTACAPPRTDWVVGVESQKAEFAYAGVQMLHSEPGKTFGLRCGGQFGGLAAQILAEENLLPRLDGKRLRFTMPLKKEVYRTWESAGILERELLDTVLLCPQCTGLPTFRFACRACGSARLTNDRLIHHYVCGHVAPASDYESAEGLVCPKCKTPKLIIGADFEYHVGKHRCQDCHWRDSELELTGHCTQCDGRFTAETAHRHRLYGYHVHRLDPLALDAAP